MGPVTKVSISVNLSECGLLSFIETFHFICHFIQCDRTIALRNFHIHLLQPPTKVGVIGSGCSIATEATSEVGPFYNLTQVY